MQAPATRAGLLRGWRFWTRSAVVAAMLTGLILTFAPASSAAEPAGSSAAPAGPAVAASDDGAAAAGFPLCTGVVGIDRAVQQRLGDEFAKYRGAFFPASAQGSLNCLIGDGQVGCANCAAIEALQDALNDCNRGGRKAIPEDGSWGPTTKAAVQVAQKINGVRADGAYGPVTRKAMRWNTVNGCQHIPL